MFTFISLETFNLLFSFFISLINSKIHYYSIGEDANDAGTTRRQENTVPGVDDTMRMRRHEDTTNGQGGGKKEGLCIE